MAALTHIEVHKDYRNMINQFNQAQSRYTAWICPLGVVIKENGETISIQGFPMDINDLMFDLNYYIDSINNDTGHNEIDFNLYDLTMGHID